MLEVVTGHELGRAAPRCASACRAGLQWGCQAATRLPLLLPCWYVSQFAEGTEAVCRVLFCQAGMAPAPPGPLTAITLSMSRLSGSYYLNNKLLEELHASEKLRLHSQHT